MVRVVARRVVMLASGRRWAAVACRREFLAHTAGRATNEICRQGISALISAPATSRAILPNCFKLHTHVQALLETTRRTLLPRSHGYRATRAPKAHIILAVLDGALEESLARLARENPVVKAAYFVSANRAGTVDQLLPRRDTGRR